LVRFNPNKILTINFRGIKINFGLKSIFNEFLRVVKKNLTAFDPRYPTYAIPNASPKLQLAPPNYIRLIK
jgi:hypothetical protein